MKTWIVTCELQRPGWDEFMYSQLVTTVEQAPTRAAAMRAAEVKDPDLFAFQCRESA